MLQFVDQRYGRQTSLLKARAAEFAGAVMLLTRLPVARWSGNIPTASCVWAYPLVGGLVGGIGAAMLLLCQTIHLTSLLAALAAIAATIFTTGALHEDGLADTADGFGGGATAARKLEIMRDSRIGSYGTLALILSVAVRAAALASEAHPALALMLACVLGRGAIVVVLAQLRPARSDGLAATLERTGGIRLTVGLCLGAIPVLVAPVASAAALITAFAVTALARRQVGGYTGDVLGAAEQAVECMAMIAMAAG